MRDRKIPDASSPLACKLFSVLHTAASLHNAYLISTFSLWIQHVGIVLWCVICVVHSRCTPCSRRLPSFRPTNCFAVKSFASIMFVGVMGLRNPRRRDHSGLSHQGLAICWVYRIRSPDGTSTEKEGVREVRGLLLGLSCRGVRVCVCGTDRQQIIFKMGVESNWAICSAEDEQQRKDAWSIQDLVYDLEFPIWYITVSTFFSLPTIMKLNFTVCLRLVPQGCINAD